MDLGSLVEPYMTVYSCSFIEPSFLESGVCAHAYKVLSAVVQIFRYVIGPGRIAARLMSEIEPVHPYERIAENAVKLQPDVLSIVLGRDGEGLSVPADAGLRIFISHGLVTMAMACFFCIREVHHPVVRQIHRGPSRGVELLGIRTLVVYRCRLCKVVEILGAAAEVLGWRRGVAEGELPVLVKVDALALALRRCCENCCNADDDCQNLFHIRLLVPIRCPGHLKELFFHSPLPFRGRGRL